MMAYLLTVEYNPDTKVGTQNLYNKISATKSSAFNNNIPGITEYITSTIEAIKD